jgi:carbonic anhydrase
VSAAIEFAVRYLNVKHIVVLGHSQCGGIRALLDGDMLGKHDSFISSWINIAKAARDEVESRYPNATLEDKAYACEQAALRLSLQNLLTFPWVKDKVNQGQLELHAWHFDLASGKLMELTPGSPHFTPIL